MTNASIVHAGEKGVDFSFARPPASRLLELGYTFIVGYISVPPASPAKNITRAECEAYLAAGLKVLLVWEMSATRANLGAAYGATDGANAKRLADALGYPPDVPIIMADDTDTTGVVAKVWAALKRVFSGGNIDAHEDYCFAALGAIGANGIGEYGDCDILERTIGLWRIGWVPNAWGWSARSRAKADERARALGAHVLQRTGYWIDNTWAVDPNEAINDFPAWGTGTTPPLPEDDMIELRSNKEDRVNQYGGVEKAGEMIFAIGDFKRNISAKERDERFPNVPLSSPLSNAVLDTIPDAVETVGGAVDFKGPINLSLSLSGGASGTVG